jgi:hypothetical protein
MASRKKFQNVTVSYKDLEKLSVGDRVSLAGSSYGSRLLSALTPEQYASLFPTYYLRENPDVRGFYQALTQSGRQAIAGNVRGTATSLPAGYSSTGPSTAAPTATTAAPAGATPGSPGGRSTVSGGDNKEVIMKAFASELRRQGVPAENIPYAVAALAGQVQAESSFNPTLEHDQGTGYGIYGARDPTPGRGRKTDMLKWLEQNGYDKNSPEGQARFMVHEAFTKPEFSSTRNALMNANRDNMGDVTSTLVNNFERPQERTQNTINRTNYAMGYIDQAHQHTQAQVGAESNVTALSPEQQQQLGGIRPLPNETQQQLAKRINDLIPSLKNTECVELAKGIVNDSRSVTEWRRGASVRDGTVPVGTPIATFMDRSGNPSNLYDGGQGVGTSNGNTTHAAVLQGYVRDTNGKIVGIRVHEQGGGAGPREREIRFGDRRGGISDATNYHVINDQEGNPLGKENNPYFRQQLAQTSQVQTQTPTTTTPSPMNRNLVNGPTVVPSPQENNPEYQPSKPLIITNSEGGEISVDSNKIEARPIGKLNGDNSVVVDENQQPLFTMNTNKETATYNPLKKTVEVTPLDNTNLRTNPDDLQPPANEATPNTLDTQEINQQQDMIPQTTQQDIPGSKQHIFDNVTQLTRDPVHCPSFRRAISESNFSSGDSTGLGVGHYGERNYSLV